MADAEIQVARIRILREETQLLYRVQEYDGFSWKTDKYALTLYQARRLAFWMLAHLRPLLTQPYIEIIPNDHG